MRNAIEEFRKRRALRLKERGYRADAEMDWITVENGEHVPLENGKAVGGPLKGRDFSKAKSTKTVAKGTATPTQKLSSQFKKIKKIKDIGERRKAYAAALKKAESGSRLYMVVGGQAFGYTKSASDWFNMYGTAHFTAHHEGAFPLHPHVDSGFLGTHLGNEEVEVFTSLKKAKQSVAKTFPRRTEHGTLVKLGPLTKVYPEATYDYSGGTPEQKAMRERIRKGVKVSPLHTDSLAKYAKSITNTKELLDVVDKSQLILSDGTPGYEIKKALKNVGVEKYHSVSIEKHGNQRVLVVKFKESHGRGKKPTYTEEKYKFTFTGKKYTYVNSEGEVLGSEISRHDIKYKVSPLKKG